MANIVATRRQAPWIGIGVSGQWKSSQDALEAARLDFNVVREDTFWWKPTMPIAQAGAGQSVCDQEHLPMYANVRDTDNKVLGCVTPQYRIIQNKDAFSLIDPFLSNGYITHAGMTSDGLCFMVAEIERPRKIGGEPYMVNLMITNSFNTKYPCQIIMTPIRIIWKNVRIWFLSVSLCSPCSSSCANTAQISSGVMDSTRVSYRTMVFILPKPEK